MQVKWTHTRMPMRSHTIGGTTHNRCNIQRTRTVLHRNRPGHESLDTGTPTSARIEVLGLFIDLELRLVRPTEAAIQDLRRTRSVFLSKPTPANFSHFAGQVIWFSYIGGVPLCEFGELMDLLRQQARQMLHPTAAWHAEDPTTFNHRVQNMCDRVRNYIVLAKTEGRQDRQPPTATIYTDASTKYIAGIRQSDDAMFIVPIKGDHRTIQTAELLGGIIAAIIFQERNFLWAVDNTVAKFAMLKGHSACRAADRALRLALDLVRHGIIALPSFVAWVPTACMRADALTRPDITPRITSGLLTCEQNCDTKWHPAKAVPRWTTPKDTHTTPHNDADH